MGYTSSFLLIARQVVEFLLSINQSTNHLENIVYYFLGNWIAGFKGKVHWNYITATSNVSFFFPGVS